MATIKSYTDLEQSKKLAEILPIESSDMHYATWTILDNEFIASPNRGSKIEDLQEEYGSQIIPAWSLAALLGVIPKHIKDYNVLRIDISENEFAIWYDEIGCGVNNELPDITKKTAIDACYEMILKLHELNLL
jgi:hypothetical protein